MRLLRMRLIEAVKKDLSKAGYNFNELPKKAQKKFLSDIDSLIKERLLKNQCEDLKTE